MSHYVTLILNKVTNIINTIWGYCKIIKISVHKYFFPNDFKFIERPQYEILCLGLAGIGKTKLLSKLIDPDFNHLTYKPTTGFNIYALSLDDFILNIKEVGGSIHLQPFWKHYYEKAQALIYIINSSNKSSLKESLKVFKSIINNVQIQNIPVLLLDYYQKNLPVENIKNLIDNHTIKHKNLEIKNCENVKEALNEFISSHLHAKSN